MQDEVLKAHGLKVTEARLQVLAILTEGKEHLTADQIYAQLEQGGVKSVSLATVYRVLTQFHEAGIIDKHQFEDGASVYEIADESHHDHIICRDCGKVTEFCDPAIERAQLRVAKELGFTLTGHTMILYGHCKNDNCADHKK